MASKIMALTLLIFALLICTVSTGDSLPREYDYRIISYQDLQSSSQTYSNSKIKEYMSLTLDIPRKQLIAGARNHILRLALDSLEPLEVEEWGTRNITRQICRAKGQSEENCHNFVKVLMRHGNQLFACGTNAFSPQCSVRELTNLGSVIKLEDGAAKCPYNPHHNSTTLMTQEGDVYTATVMDFAARDVAIYRNTGPSPVLRTVQYNSKWLNEPVFVSSYEIGELVFFFFRETATEFINCGKSVYPRVAKVCKNDKGGEFLWKDNWTTFQKARLNCSIPGDYPFYYNELQSTYYQKEQGLVYMVFTTPVSSMYGSAVCVYNMTAFQRAFEGPFKYQESSKHAWTQHENPFPNYRCESIKERKAGMSQTDIGNAQKYQMMDSAVQPVSLHPFATTTNERWSHIVVDTVEGKHKSEFQVMFLVNKEGVLKKIVHLPNKTEACVLEEINIFPEGQKRPVYNMELFNGNIYISTSGEVIKIQVHRCDRFKTRKSCLLSMDPYCGWSSKENKCVRPPRGHTRAHYWHQRQINRCPVMDYPINGEWSSWASWSSCGQVGEYSPGDQCLCRSRSCDKPAPMFGGKKCDGSNIQVTNCTRHGGWTVWSTWSACSQSCGTAMRSRTRSCSNPAPQFGGRVCIGQERIDENCVNNPSCPVPTKIPLDGGWTRWTEWEGCTAQCGGGFQRRYRSCTNPPPQNGGVHCDGNNEQWKTCNTGTCNEIRKSSAWTGWVIRNITNGGFIKQRFQFTCRASVPLDSALKEPAIRMQERFCLEGGEDCSDSGETFANIPPLPPTQVIKHYCKQWYNVLGGFCQCGVLGNFLVCRKCDFMMKNTKSSVISYEDRNHPVGKDDRHSGNAVNKSSSTSAKKSKKSMHLETDYSELTTERYSLTTVLPSNINNPPKTSPRETENDIDISNNEGKQETNFSFRKTSEDIVEIEMKNKEPEIKDVLDIDETLHENEDEINIIALQSGDTLDVNAHEDIIDIDGSSSLDDESDLDVVENNEEISRKLDDGDTSSGSGDANTNIS